MELNIKGLKDRAAWAAAGIQLPGYDIEETAALAKRAPRWVHFGAGNIFRLFLGGIADELLEKGLLDRGVNCIEVYDEEIADKIYGPYDNLALSVLLLPDGSRRMKALGSVAEAVKASDRARMLALFESASLQLISFTITEKGYATEDGGGALLPAVKADAENGPGNTVTAIGAVCAGLLRRYECGRLPVALVSMDNCAANGRLLKRAVGRIAEAWAARGYAEPGFSDYLNDETAVAFCCTMIDKITPRPGRELARDLEALGIENMQPVETAKRTYIAPFANGEKAQYLVIEDRFPNGRPPLEEAYGVYTGDFETVNKAERMKVTALLNPVHTATGPLGVVLGRERFADMLNGEPVMMKMAKTVAYTEGMPMAPDPGILSPQAFADELFTDRFVNVYLCYTNLPLSTDASQALAVRPVSTVHA
jgi:fructuronate reductase